jgi:hypothetical protein
MATINKDVTKARWDSRAAKRFVDELTFRAMAPWAMTGPKLKRILSLPAADWLWERSFTTTFPKNWATFVGVEKSQPVWRKMKATAENQSTVNRNHQFVPCPRATDMAKFLAETPEKYDMIYLDWMGTWSVAKERQLISIFKRRLLNKGGLLRMTMALDRGKKSIWAPYCEEDSAIMGFQDLRGVNTPLPEWKVYGIPRMIMNTAEDLGVKLKLISAIAYTSREHPLKKGTPESSFIFRV